MDYYEQRYRERMVNNLHKKAQAFGFELIPQPSANLVSWNEEKKRMRLQDEPELPAQINPAQIKIVPMIDVIFATLTFFIMSTLYLTRSEGLPVNLPQAGRGKIDRPVQVILTINNTGKIFLNKEAVSLDHLAAQVREKVEPSQPLMVLLNADAVVNHGQVVAVMDKVRQLEEVKLGIATRK
jgi:biopolymer transport protein ExbD